MTSTALQPRGHMGRTKAVPASDLAALRADYADTSDFAAAFGGGSYRVERYDTARIDLVAEVWRELAARGFVDVGTAGDLGALHEQVAAQDRRLDALQINAVTRAFAETPRSRAALLARLVGEVVAPLVGRPLYRQAHMTLRFHFPEGAVAARRRSLFHSDVMLGHPPQMLNVWVPVSSTTAGNTLLVVDLDVSLRVMLDHDFDFEAIAMRVQYDDAFYDGLMDAAEPVVVGPGEILLFDARCLHAGQVNVSDRTRVSTDLRVLAADTLERLRKPYESGGRRMLRFAPGEFLAAEAVQP
ncbi:MAG TPA: phytanoyl-CoA dioxygenase family protein [Euzebyales bacterium]|nr:phytanoyl-CoA dioxygenase family protein [Euzebyales bacterium]